MWADFGGDQDETIARPPVLDGAATEPAPVPGGAATVIRLLGCPPDLLLAHDDNLADIARELSLFGASHADPEAVRSAEQIVEVVRLSALSWGAARLAARQALDEHRRHVDVAIAVTEPLDLPRKVAVLRRAVAAAEAMSARGLLITMTVSAPGPAVAGLGRGRDDRAGHHRATAPAVPGRGAGLSRGQATAAAFSRATSSSSRWVSSRCSRGTVRRQPVSPKSICPSYDVQVMLSPMPWIGIDSG